MKQLLIKVGFFMAYIPFAGWSAWMTATSFHLNALSRMPFWMAYFMVFVIALIAGFFLNQAIREPMRQNPSRSKFAFYLLVFVFFWGVSFMTNVHYNYIVQHGYENLSAQVHSCINFLNTTIDKNDAVYDTRKDDAKQRLKEQVANKRQEFHNSLNDTRDGRNGFGQDCITALNAIEGIFASDVQIYKDGLEYIVFDEVSDVGDLKKDKYKDKSYLLTKYDERINDCLNKRYIVIDKYYDNQKGNNTKAKEALALAIEIEKKGLSQIRDTKDFERYYDCYDKNIKELLKLMPDGYNASTMKMMKDKNGNEIMECYTVYPSERMFDWLTVWGDWWDNQLPENSNFKSGMPTALMWDVVAFLLVSMI